MVTEAPRSLLTRRRLLSAGTIVGGTTVLAACINDPDPPYGPTGTVVAGPAPQVPDDPTSGMWRYGAEEIVSLDGQTLAQPMRPKPSVAHVKVRVIHDETSIGFRLTWVDAEADDLTVAADRFRDACAVLLAPGEGDQALRMMGSTDKPATLLHWKADWQRDIDHGRQGLEAAFPNAVVDVYTPLGTSTGVTPQTYVDRGAAAWLPGLNAGNPMSAATRNTPVEKLLAGGFGTAETAPTQNCRGRGTRTGTGWTVSLVRPLAATDPGELQLAPGVTCTCAFAIWAGSEQDGGSRKSPSLLAFPLRVA